MFVGFIVEKGSIVRNSQSRKALKCLLLFGHDIGLDKCKVVFYDKKVLELFSSTQIVEKGKERYGGLPFIVFKFRKPHANLLLKVFDTYGFSNGKLFGFSTPTEIYFTDTRDFGINRLVQKEELDMLKKLLRRNRIKFKSEQFCGFADKSVKKAKSKSSIRKANFSEYPYSECIEIIE